MKIKSIRIKLCLILCICLSLNLGVHAQRNQHDILINLGFTQDEIKTMTQEELSRFADVIDAKLIGKEEVYYEIKNINGKSLVNKVNKATLISRMKKNILSSVSIIDTDTTETNWLKMTTTVSTINNKEYAVKNSFNWITNPNITMKDVIGITVSSNMVPVENSEYMKYEWTEYKIYDDPVHSPVYGPNAFKYYWSAQTKDNAGYAVTYDIHNYLGGGIDSTDSYTLAARNHHGYMILRAVPAFDMSGYGKAYGHYQHQKITIGITPTVDLHGGNMTVSPKFYFSKMDDTDVGFNFN